MVSRGGVFVHLVSAPLGCATGAGGVKGSFATKADELDYQEALAETFATAGEFLLRAGMKAGNPQWLHGATKGTLADLGIKNQARRSLFLWFRVSFEEACLNVLLRLYEVHVVGAVPGDLVNIV